MFTEHVSEEDKLRMEWCLWDGAARHSRFNKTPCNTVHFSIYLISEQAHKYQVADLGTNVLMNYRHFSLTRFNSQFCVQLLWMLVCDWVFYAVCWRLFVYVHLLFFLCVGGKNECLQKQKHVLSWILLISVEQNAPQGSNSERKLRKRKTKLNLSFAMEHRLTAKVGSNHTFV